MKKDTMPQVAKFWNNIAEDFDAIYTGNKHPLAVKLDRWLRRDIFERFDWVMERSGNVAGKSVCDIGCGSGRFLVEFAKRGAGSITGVDVAPEMLKLAQNLLVENRVQDRCELIEADVLNWRTDKIYDLTIAIGFWDYIMEPPERLRCIRKISRNKFLSAWPRFWTWRMPVRKVRLEYVSGCPVYFFRRSQVVNMINNAGFRVERCDTVGKLFCVEATVV